MLGKHAQKIISTICDYFLTQRVKPESDDYLKRLGKHHIVIIDAMKAKQNVDMEIVKKIKKEVEALLPYYPAQKHLIKESPNDVSARIASRQPGIFSQQT